MACGKVGDVILSSTFLVVTQKTESPFLKRKVVNFSLLWFALLHSSWPEIRFYVAKTTKMNTLWEFRMFYTHVVQVSPQESLVSIVCSFPNYFQRT